MKDMKMIVDETLKVLKEGGIILYPTDTIWGLGCDATNPEAVAKIYEIKHRSDSKALVLLASDMDMICRFVKVIPDIAVQLVEVNDRPMTLIYPGAIHGKALQREKRLSLTDISWRIMLWLRMKASVSVSLPWSSARI